MNCQLVSKEWSKVSKKDQQMVLSTNGCIFCHSSSDENPDFNEYITHVHTGMKMHYFCLVLSSGLKQTYGPAESNTKNDPDHIYGFGIKDIIAEVRRAKKLRCSHCHQTGASIGCIVKRCKKKMHYPCGQQKRALSRFYDTFGTWCEAHRPKPELYDQLPLYTPSVSVLKERRNGDYCEENDALALKVKQSDDDVHTCFACLEDLTPPFDEAQVLVSACCLRFYSHKVCLQRLAASCGLHFFRCPGCNNMDKFQASMLNMGIYIPDRDASWETENEAYSDLLFRYNTCDIPNCCCPKGRDYSEEKTQWAVVLCDMCGSSGTHIACSNDVTHDKSYFVCAPCVGTMGEEAAFHLAKDMGILVDMDESLNTSSVMEISHNDSTNNTPSTSSSVSNTQEPRPKPRKTKPRKAIPRKTIPPKTKPRKTVPPKTKPRKTIPPKTVPPKTVPQKRQKLQSKINTDTKTNNNNNTNNKKKVTKKITHVEIVPTAKREGMFITRATARCAPKSLYNANTDANARRSRRIRWKKILYTPPQ